MSFHFNFGSPSPDVSSIAVPASQTQQPIPCSELHFSSHLPKLHIQPTRIHPALLINNPFITTIHYNTPGHKDIEKGVYEGGLALWEAAIDLVAFIEKNENTEKYIKRKRIMELGCGAGIPGIYAIEGGATSVDFQDYNAQVLETMTMPNLLLNTIPHEGENDEEERWIPIPRVFTSRFFAGDWGSMKNLNLQEYDTILMSETLYNPDMYSVIHDVLSQLLLPKGTAIIAAKSYYFGVGGSIAEFCHFVEQKGVFAVETEIANDEGVRRELVILNKLTQPTPEVSPTR